MYVTLFNNKGANIMEEHELDALIAQNNKAILEAEKNLTNLHELKKNLGLKDLACTQFLEQVPSNSENLKEAYKQLDQINDELGDTFDESENSKRLKKTNSLSRKIKGRNQI